METLSFILGIALVVVIAIAVVATYAFVKVGKIQREIENTDRELVTKESGIYQYISAEISALHRRIDELETNMSRRVDEFEKDIYSQLDSRLDKLENKLVNNKK